MNPLASALEDRSQSGGWRDSPSCSSSCSISSPASSSSSPFFPSSSSTSSVYSVTSPAKGFGRKRRQSVSSSSCSDYSDASPYTASNSASPIPRKTSCPEGALLSRLRGLLHDLPSDGNAYQRLLDGVTNAMEEDSQSRCIWKQPKMEVSSQPASPFQQLAHCREEFPPDLMSVDVSAFASLIMYQRPV